jgi:uncharacterized membrane protein
MDASATAVQPLGMDATVRWTRFVAVASLLALIVLGLAWELWLAPTGSGTLALKVLPLLVPLRGLWNARMYTYRWTALLVWLYVTEALVRASTESGLSAQLALAQLLLCLVLFGACALHVRWRLHRVKQAARP